MKTMVIVGLDLTGVETRPTGYCEFVDMNIETFLIYTDKEILERITRIQPVIVAVDAPLSLPPGRKTLGGRNSSHLRDCD